MSDDRYQYQPRYIKIFRYMLWKPIFLYLFIYWTIMFLIYKYIVKMPCDGFSIKQLYMLCCSMCDMKIKHYYTLEEIKERISQ